MLAVAQGFLGAVPEAANGNAPGVAAIDELGQRLAVETARGNASMTAGIDRLNRQMAAMTETIARQQAALDRIAAKLARVA